MIDNFTEIQHLIQSELNEVDAFIKKQLESELAIIPEIGNHLIQSGGKRLRPILLLLSAKACDYKGSQHIPLAGIIEFIHSATLFHDDVVDAAEMRRGKLAANQLWGNKFSVLLGDYIYSRVFQQLVKIGHLEVMAILADATNQLTKGEIRQLDNSHNAKVTKETYFQVIEDKTAILFAAATHIGALIANTDINIQHSLREYGLNLGMAFQLMDDVLDYQGDAKEIGKAQGTDFAEGKFTLPLIYALEQSKPEEKKQLLAAIENKDIQEFPKIKLAIESLGGIEYTLNQARGYIEQAIAHLKIVPDSKYKTGLEQLATFTIARNH